MKKVFLKGDLGQKFGEEWEFNVKTTAEAIQALFVNTKNELRSYLIKSGLDKKYQVIVDGKNINKDLINDPFKNNIYIIPVLEGSDEVLQTIIGVTLIVVGAITGLGFLTQIGIAMTVGGIAQMLTPTPKTKDDSAQSTTFSSVDRPIRQGMPVPIAYGKVMVEPLPISISLRHRDA